MREIVGRFTQRRLLPRLRKVTVSMTFFVVLMMMIMMFAAMVVFENSILGWTSFTIKSFEWIKLPLVQMLGSPSLPSPLGGYIATSRRLINNDHHQTSFDHHFATKPKANHPVVHSNSDHKLRNAPKSELSSSTNKHPSKTKPKPKSNDTELPPVDEINVIAPFPDDLSSSVKKKKEHFVIFSTSNKGYYKSYVGGGIHVQHDNHPLASFTYVYPTAQYAKRYNYSFLSHPDTFDYERFRLKGHPILPHFLRIFAALQLMRNEVSSFHGPPIDWIVYMDTDAFIAEPDLPLEAIVDAAEAFKASVVNNKSEPADNCQFIAQEHGAIVNSGFFFLKNTEWGIKFMERWIEECEKAWTRKHIGWSRDQGPLQNVILHDAAKIRQVPYNDECWFRTSDHDANLCWNDRMNGLVNVPLGKRHVGKICLLPRNVGIPYLHHYHHDCVPGNILCHQKTLTREDIAKYSHLLPSNNHERSGLIIKYDSDSKTLVLRENMIVFSKRWLNESNHHEKSLLQFSSGKIKPLTQTLPGPYFDYQAFFYFIDEQNQRQPIDFTLSQADGVTTPLNITGKYTFHLDHHIIPSPIKELLDLASNDMKKTSHSTKNQPTIHTIEVEDEFLHRIPLSANNCITISVSKDMYTSLLPAMMIGH